MVRIERQYKPQLNRNHTVAATNGRPPHARMPLRDASATQWQCARPRRGWNVAKGPWQPSDTLLALIP